MLKNVWIQELADEAKSAWVVLRSFWLHGVWPVLMTLWIFFVFAAPLIIVILMLWYLDSIGWQSGPGFYTIGSAAGPDAPPRTAWGVFEGYVLAANLVISRPFRTKDAPR